MKKTTKLLLVLMLVVIFALATLAFAACNQPTIPDQSGNGGTSQGGNDTPNQGGNDKPNQGGDNPAKPTVTVNANGGTFDGSITVNDDGTLTAPSSIPTKPNHKFDGWYKDEDCTIKWNFETDKVTVNITIYIKWIRVYDVTFNTNGGSVIDPIEADENTTITKPIDPIKDGYTFAGWHKETDCTTAWSFDTDKVTQNVTLHAKWNAKEYSVTFKAEDEIVSVENYTVESITVTEPTVPAKEGYNGVWEDYTVSIGNITVNAIYTAKQYNVTLDYNGAMENNTQQNITITYDRKVGELPEPERLGYYFMGWHYENEYITSSTIWNIDENDAILTAKWMAKIYTITFVGEKKTITQNYTVETTVTEPTVPAKEGYNGVWENYTLTIGNITVNAVYTAKQYNVTLDYNGATGNNSQQSITVTYDEVIGAMPTPTKAGYVFEGWQYDGDIVTALTVWKTDASSPITFTAIWSGPYYTVTFNSNGGSEVADLTNILCGSLIAEPQAPTKDLEEFLGWYSDSEFNIEWNFATDTVVNNITLYAKWTKIFIGTEGLEYKLNSDGQSYYLYGLGKASNYKDLVVASTYQNKPVTSIGASAFDYNSKIESVVIADSILSIGYQAFYNCSALRTVVIGNGVKTIDSDAFRNCKKLNSITLGRSITSIGNYIFWGSNNLTEIKYEGTVAQWKSISKGSSWNYNVPATKVICSDGEVEL